MKMVAKNWAMEFLPLLLLIFSPGVATTNPGLVVRITQNGLDYAKQHVIVFLQREASNITLPDFEGYYYVNYIGYVFYNFHSLVNQGVHLKNLYVSLLPWEGVKVSTSDSSVSFTGNWEITKFFITIGGTFDLKIENIYISMCFKLDRDRSAKPTITISDYSSFIGNVSISISGTFSWLVNLFSSSIESGLKRILDEKIREKVISFTDTYIQSYIQTLPVIVKIDEISSLNYSLSEPPQITRNNLNVMLKGEFFSNTYRSPVHFEAPPMNLPRENSHMIYFGISDYLFNTASMVYQEAGLMNFSITNDMIPLETGVSLNTDLFSNLIPELTSTYPNMLMEFQVFPAKSPLLVFSPGKATLKPEIYVEAFVVSPDSPPKSVFLLSVKANVSVKATLTSRRITGSIRLASRLVLEMKYSAFGRFKVSAIEQTLNFLASLFLFPAANAKLQTGFSLPLTRDISFYDFILQPCENYLLLGTKIRYGPESKNLTGEYQIHDWK